MIASANQTLTCDVLVIGAGAAGCAAATSAARAGASVILAERGEFLGGILQQCIHNGFGLHRFGEELTGPEYAGRDIVEVNRTSGIDVHLGWIALSLERDGDSLAATFACTLGIMHVRAASVVLACGCRERTRSQVGIAGGRPAGVMCAGTAQRLINVEGALVGRRVVILGSGDIGLIMARRMTWEGAKVLCVCELMDQPGGLRRNIVQCLEDNDIPLYLSRTVTRVIGRERLEAVELTDVDPATRKPIPGTEQVVECDALLLSVGLVPETTVALTAGIQIDPATGGPAVDESLQTSVPGVFVAGNELHVHDLADYVSEEGALAGERAASWALASDHVDKSVFMRVIAGENVGSITPQHIGDATGEVVVRLRSRTRVEDAVIRFESAGTTIRSVRRRIVVPSEMQTVRLKPDEVQKATGEIVVSVVARGEGE